MELLCPHCQERVEAELGDEFCPECGQPIKATLAEAGSDPTAAAADPSSIAGSASIGGSASVGGSAPIGSSASIGGSASIGDPTSAASSAPIGGAATPTLLVKVEGRPPLRYTGAPILVGRLDEVSGSIPDLPFNDPAISRRHLTIWQEGAKILVQDGSTNGTFRAGLRLPQGAPVELDPGDSLSLPGQMGTYTIRFELA